ncbi:MAG: D-alanyl-D-alanine carboxypeptidase family protein [Bacilli bacterium]
MKRKLNYKKIALAFIVVVVVILLIIFGIKGISSFIKNKNSYEHKLSLVGYKKDEIKILLKNFEKNDLENILKIDYNENLANYSEQKYFNINKLNEYTAYLNKNKKSNIKETIAVINTGADKEEYDDIRKTDLSKGILMLVNKYNYLESSYVPKDIVSIPTTYAYEGKSMSKEAMENLIYMLDAARESKFTIVVSSGYRSYSDQEKVYNNYKSIYSTRQADDMIFRPGFSESQTGLSIALEPYSKEVSDVKTSEEHKWLEQNAYKYGFIFRYPANSKALTKADPSDWRMRYVGEVASTKIHNEKITFEEYYKYYVEKK